MLISVILAILNVDTSTMNFPSTIALRLDVGGWLVDERCYLRDGESNITKFAGTGGEVSLFRSFFLSIKHR